MGLREISSVRSKLAGPTQVSNVQPDGESWHAVGRHAMRSLSDEALNVESRKLDARVGEGEKGADDELGDLQGGERLLEEAREGPFEDGEGVIAVHHAVATQGKRYERDDARHEGSSHEGIEDHKVHDRGRLIANTSIHGKNLYRVRVQGEAGALD